MSQLIIDTRERGAGAIVELLDDRRVRLAIVLRYPTIGLYGYQHTLTAEQARELWYKLGVLLLEGAAPGVLGNIFGATLCEQPPDVELHAPAAAAGIACNDVDSAAPAAEWENPFA